MEGSYSKVWSAREEAPAEEYKFFVDSLMGTIRFVVFWNFEVHAFIVFTCYGSPRNEIASCEETAYDSLPISEAAQLLFFKSSHDLIRFAQGVGTKFHPPF